MPTSFDLTEFSSNATNGFIKTIAEFFQSPLDPAIAKAHADLIQKVIKDAPPEASFDLLCGYKKLVKEHSRKRDIAEKAMMFLEDSSKTPKFDNDWLEFFFDKVRLISNEDMQLIWAKILAEEANNEGSIPLSLLHALSIITHDQAMLFCNICRFTLRAYKRDTLHPIIFISTNRDAYMNSGITPSNLKSLERLGLIECDFAKEYVFRNKMVLTSGNKILTVHGDPSNGNKVKAGNVKLTENGIALYRIVDDNFKTHNHHIFEFIINRFKYRNCRVLVNDEEI